MALRIACLQTRAYALEEAPTASVELLASIDKAAEGSDLLLLPECAYPSYVLREGDVDAHLRGLGAPTTGEFVQQLAERALRHRINIAAGVALTDGDKLYNALVLFDREGRQIARTDKQFLWHFDSRWFSPGSDFVVAEVDGVKVGLFICADGRLPEIPRILALRGARLLLDATNWVTSGRDPANLANPQPDYMMSVRAAENGCWIAAANKVGRERDSVVYCGKSLVLRADGSTAAKGSSDQVEVLRVAIPLGADGQPEGSGRMPVERHPAAYTGLSRAHVPAALEAPAPYTAVIQTEDAESLRAELGIHGVDLSLAADGSVHVHGEPVHLRPGEVLDTAAGRLAAIDGEQVWLPEVARLLALDGADFLLWTLPGWAPWVEAVARTRAAENRVFVLVATPPENGGESLIVDPGGVVLARTFPGARQAVAALCPTALARLKTIVPGTDALGGRRPELYADLWT